VAYVDVLGVNAIAEVGCDAEEPAAERLLALR
jgi:hypothetical protein